MRLCFQQTESNNVLFAALNTVHSQDNMLLLVQACTAVCVCSVGLYRIVLTHSTICQHTYVQTQTTMSFYTTSTYTVQCANTNTCILCVDIHTYVCMYVRTHNTYMYIRMYANRCIRTYVHVRTYTHLWISLALPRTNRDRLPWRQRDFC